MQAVSRGVGMKRKAKLSIEIDVEKQNLLNTMYIGGGILSTSNRELTALQKMGLIQPKPIIFKYKANEYLWDLTDKGLKIVKEAFK